MSNTPSTLALIKQAAELYLRPLNFPRRKNKEMEEKRRRAISSGLPIRSLFGEGLTIKGEIHAEKHGFRIDCHLIGDIISHDGLVVISETAFIEGNVSANYIVVSGKVKGNLTATHAIELQPTAIVEGDVYAAVFEMHMGAAVRGKMEASEVPNTKKFELLREEARKISRDTPLIRLVN